jgi:hypothetical protein
MNLPHPVTPSGSPDLGIRIVYMLLFAVVFWLLCWILAAATLVQLIVRILNARPNPELVRFGGALGRYARQVIEFLTFVTELTPYPFAAWPAEG